MNDHERMQMMNQIYNTVREYPLYSPNNQHEKNIKSAMLKG